MELGAGVEIMLKKVNKYGPAMCQGCFRLLILLFLKRIGRIGILPPTVQIDKGTGTQELAKCHNDVSLKSHN